MKRKRNFVMDKLDTLFIFIAFMVMMSLAVWSEEKIRGRASLEKSDVNKTRRK